MTLQRPFLKFWRITEARRANPENLLGCNLPGFAGDTPALDSGLHFLYLPAALTPRHAKLLWRVRPPTLGCVHKSWSQNESPPVAKEFGAQKDRRRIVDWFRRSKRKCRVTFIILATDMPTVEAT